MPALSRTLFATIAVMAIAAVFGAGCTRRGGNGVPPVVTPTPITTYYVDPVKGSDSNSGSSSAPFKTLTKAMKVVKASASGGLTISMSAGAYSAKSGEVFPIVIPTGVTLAGNTYGRSIAKAAFINGSGEDTDLEKALKKPPHTFYAAVEVAGGASAVMDKVYVGTTVPPAAGSFASVISFGALNASSDTFGEGVRTVGSGGILLAGGTLNCTACIVQGRDYGIEAFSLPSETSAPSIRLQGPGQSVIGADDGIRTDGTASVIASAQLFASRNSAYTDALAIASPSSSPSSSPLPDAATSPTASPTAIPTSGSSSSQILDFGYGGGNSTGGNTFGRGKSEIMVTVGGQQLVARNNTWLHYGQQGANGNGQYATTRVFRPSARGVNVTILSSASGSLVVVGPPPAPTPTPSPTPSTSPTSSPTATPK